MVQRAERLYALDSFTNSGPRSFLGRIQELDQSGPARIFDVQRYQDGKYFYQKRLPDEDIASFTCERTARPEKLLMIQTSTQQS